MSFMVGVYVDDIMISDDKNACKTFFAQLEQRFPVKDKGN